MFQEYSTAGNPWAMRRAATTDGLPDLSYYESITQGAFHRGQLAPIRGWIRGLVLDVGAGFGRFSILSPSTISLDIEKRWLLRGIKLGNIAHAVRGTAVALPFKQKSFDTVLALGIAEHIPPPSMSIFLDELTRVTRPGGRLVVRVSSPYAPFALLRIRMWSDYLHPYSPFRVRTALIRRGWRHIASMSSGLLGVTPILPHTVNALVPWARQVSLVFMRWS